MYWKSILFSFLGFISKAGLALAQRTPTGIVKTGTISLPIGVVFLTLWASIAFSQSAPQPTGIQHNGVISFLRTESKISLGMGMPPTEVVQELFTGAFATSDYTNYVPPSLTAQLTTIGPCIVAVTGAPGSLGTPPVVTPLDAGQVLNVTGPNGTQQAPVLMSPRGPSVGIYSTTLGGGIPLPSLPFPIPGLMGPKPLWLDPGSYTVDNGGGGADVGGFTATITIPTRFAWTNADSDLTITLASGVDIQWTGGDPNSMVEIQGASITSTSPAAGASFTCVVPNTGEFMVTSDVLSMIPPTPAGLTPALSTLTVGTFGQGNFSAPGVDTGLIVYNDGWTRQVVYQ